MRQTETRIRSSLLILSLALGAGGRVGAQEASSASAQPSLGGLLARAQAANPAVQAAQARVDAARARIGPAGLRPDPMLMVGAQNVPTHGEPDNMTMAMVGVEQTFTHPAKLQLRRRVAERELAAAEARLAAARLDVERDTRDAYYELAFLDRALEVVERNRTVLAGSIRAAEARYGAGVGGQQDVLKARTEAARLADQAVMLREQRRGTLARLNAALDRGSEIPVSDPDIPTRIARAAVAETPGQIRFASQAFGARAADSPLPARAALEEMAVEHSPVLREYEEMLAAQADRIELTQRERMPDFDLSVQYGARPGMPDMVSAQVSVPLPLQRRSKQNLFVAEARSDLEALEAERHTRRNQLRADVARLHAELERARAQLALLKKATLPQAQATVQATAASFGTGRADLLALLDAQGTLFQYDTEYFRLLSDFARNLAELERLVGKEVL